MILQWFLSRSVRNAAAMRKHVRRILSHQRDILPPKAVEEVESAMRQMDECLAGGADKAALEKQMENLEGSANKWLKPYPNASFRENIEVLLVALTVAMGVRTFFLQPFKIPTGSMQPSLYGVTSENLINKRDFKIPTGWQRINEWFQGTSYLHIVADNDGELQKVEQPLRLLIFNIKQTLWVGGKSYTLLLPPDFGAGQNGTLEARAELHRGQFFHKGDDIVKLRVTAGDHLFVDRLSYNFRPPKRGEIVVFETHGITRLPPEQQDTFYIKRLVGLGGETLSLQQDYEVTGVPGFGTLAAGNLVIDGQLLSEATPHFEKLYTFYGAPGNSKVLPYQENHYYGHAMVGALAPGNEFKIRPNYLFVMGDNTMNSLDSRYWGDFQASSVIGRSFFVYWPLTIRFGCSCIRQ
jgi:signal peptidase I